MTSLCASLKISTSDFGIINCVLSSVQLLSRVQLFATPWTAARQASLSITNSWSSLKSMSIVSVMPSNHLILCCPLLLLPSIFPSIRVFSSESAGHHQVAKGLDFQLQHQSFQWTPTTNPRDREAWWAAVYGVAQSQTRLKQLSSSSSSRIFHCVYVPKLYPFICWWTSRLLQYSSYCK